VILAATVGEGSFQRLGPLRARLMGNPSGDSGVYPERWKNGTTVQT